MNGLHRRSAPVVRLPPRSNVELLLAHGARIAMISIGLVAFIFALKAGSFLLAPVAMAVVIGLMLGPVAKRIEKRGLPTGVSAIVVVLVFLLVVGAFVTAIATPLSAWAGRIPEIWNELQFKLTSFREPLNTLERMREEIRSVTGESEVTVTVDEGSPIQSVALLAPAVGAQVLIFIASLYFFIATRFQTRALILKLCFDRRLRWRVAHIFRDVETLVSKYLLSITVINVGLGCAVAAALWAVGVPSPALWGILAALLNFVVYVGPAVMALILLGVGLATFETITGSLVPPVLYLGLNMMEAQFVTPTVIGRTMTLNPFVVFLALAFWLWVWGPIGGFIAIPALLIVVAVFRNIVPGIDWSPPPSSP